MKIKNSIYRRTRAAFTLIEMIGVLAVIAILASLLVPKIFTAINDARINSTAVSYNTVKTAIMDHYAKYGSLANNAGTPISIPLTNGFDKVLVTEGFLDKPFAVKLGDGTTNTTIQLVAGLLATNSVTAANSAYDLDGSGTTGNDAGGSAVVQAIIANVSEADARELSLLIDGPTMSTAAVGADDTAGRVKYASAATTTVYVYVTHR